MGLFKKKESTHFERDEKGRVVQVTRNGQQVDPDELKMKSARQLEQEYYSRHPEKRHPTLTKIGRGLQKVDKKIVDYNKTSNIMNSKRTGKSSRRSYSLTRDPWTGMFDTGYSKPSSKKKSSSKYTVIGGKAYPIARSSSKKKKKSRDTMMGFDMMDNWGFF